MFLHCGIVAVKCRTPGFMLRRLDRSASNVVAEAGIPGFEDWPECAIECFRPGLRQLLTFGKAPADGGGHRGFGQVSSGLLSCRHRPPR